MKLFTYIRTVLLGNGKVDEADHIMKELQLEGKRTTKSLDRMTKAVQKNTTATERIAHYMGVI